MIRTIQENLRRMKIRLDQIEQRLMDLSTQWIDARDEWSSAMRAGANRDSRQFRKLKAIEDTLRDTERRHWLVRQTWQAAAETGELVPIPVPVTSNASLTR